MFGRNELACTILLKLMVQVINLLLHLSGCFCVPLTVLLHLSTLNHHYSPYNSYIGIKRHHNHVCH